MRAHFCNNDGACYFISCDSIDCNAGRHVCKGVKPESWGWYASEDGGIFCREHADYWRKADQDEREWAEESAREAESEATDHKLSAAFAREVE
jgi:hypothetical protein